MRVLVACEESQTVTRAFRLRGHEAYSCDLQECSGGHPEWHIRADVLTVLEDGWDLMIGHPECKYLCLSSARWFEDPRYPDRQQRFEEAVDFFITLQQAPIGKICLENSQPLGRTIQRIGRPDQCVQPWQFGQPVTKGCYLWLQGLPPLITTHTLDDYDVEIRPECHWTGPSAERSKIRSKFPGVIADAMAAQWGDGHIPEFTTGLFKEMR